jgi:glutamate synthase (NADPH/NADH) small chain
MGKPTGFLEVPRQLPDRRDVQERVRDYFEVEGTIDRDITRQQAARCMDCGVPFCHHGCPLGNIIPEFNDAVYQGNWKQAYEILIATNNFPEFTGRICPAPCETSCVLGINKPAVAIEYIEKSIIEKAFEEGWVQPRVPSHRTGKRVAVVGAGPAGLAAAAELNYAGHEVTVVERADEIGGLLRYGIPDFKLDKQVLNRRLDLLAREGVKFKTGVSVGDHISAGQLREDFDAVVLCTGSTIPRDLPIAGRALPGIHFAMDFLTQQNRRVNGRPIGEEEIIATGKHVVVIGGGDTGSDCVGTSNRHGARSVTQLEILPKPPGHRTTNMPWPNWPMILRTSTSHEEGCERRWSVVTKEFTSDASGHVSGLRLIDVEWPVGQNTFREVPGTERIIPCDLALLAMGFLHPQQSLLEQFGIERDERGNARTQRFQTSVPGVFAAGDARRGQSLVVWAIREGRDVAKAVAAFLQ